MTASLQGSWSEALGGSGLVVGVSSESAGVRGVRVSANWANVPDLPDPTPKNGGGLYARVMDPVDLEALALRLVDKVKRHGYAVEYDVEDASILRDFLEREGRNCGFEIRIGNLSADEHSVWAYRPKVGGYWHPITDTAQ